MELRMAGDFVNPDLMKKIYVGQEECEFISKAPNFMKCIIPPTLIGNWSVRALHEYGEVEGLIDTEIDLTLAVWRIEKNGNDDADVWSGTAGGRTVTLKGRGFGTVIEDLKVEAAGSPCVVTEATGDTITCDLGPCVVDNCFLASGHNIRVRHTRNDPVQLTMYAHPSEIWSTHWRKGRSKFSTAAGYVDGLHIWVYDYSDQRLLSHSYYG